MLRGSVEVDTYGIHTTLDGLVECMFEFRLIDVVLILSHADALGINLHEFCQRIHQTASYRYGATHGDILIREFVACNLRSGIDGGTILGDGEYLRLRQFFSLLGIDVIAASEHILDEVVGLAAGCTVADGDGLYLELANHLLDGQRCLCALVDGRVGEDGFVVEQIALSVETHHLAARAEPRVDAHHPLLT